MPAGARPRLSTALLRPPSPPPRTLSMQRVAMQPLILAQGSTRAHAPACLHPRIAPTTALLQHMLARRHVTQLQRLRLYYHASQRIPSTAFASSSSNKQYHRMPSEVHRAQALSTRSGTSATQHRLYSSEATASLKLDPFSAADRYQQRQFRPRYPSRQNSATHPAPIPATSPSSTAAAAAAAATATPTPAPAPATTSAATVAQPVFESGLEREHESVSAPVAYPPTSSRVAQPPLVPAPSRPTFDPAYLPTESSTTTTTTTKPTSTDVRSTGAELDDTIVAQAPVELSTEQRFLLKQVINKKKSVFFTGSAGTGKSVLLRQLIEELKTKYQPGQVAVTASTGIAACNIGGCTLHTFAGVGLGSGTVEQLINKVESNKRARARWKKVKVLIIDEISMIDGDLFDKLEQIAKKYKRSEKPFGGIQLVITGDFFQLPPVLNHTLTIAQDPTLATSSFSSPTAIKPRIRGSQSTTTIIKKKLATNPDGGANDAFQDEFLFLDDDLSYLNAPALLPPDAATISADTVATTADGSLPSPAEAVALLQPTLCFDAQSWKSCIEYTLQLTEVFRQRDPVFVKMLNEMRHGKLSDETCRTFRELERTPQYPDDGIEPIELFALRYQVDQANHRHLANLPGPMYVYEPQDDGPLSEYMDKACTAPSKLQLKENAQVMLIKNLTPTLVNGSMGLVVGFEEDRAYDAESGTVVRSHFPIVRFHDEEDDLVVKPEEWRMELPNGEVMASRIQVPLILAWAISIHKSQGQTMERVKVDMGKIFESGQAYVALSRATSLAGLQVLNFNKRSVQAHERVAEFYDGLVTVQDLMAQDREAEAKLIKSRSRRRKKKDPLE